MPGTPPKSADELLATPLAELDGRWVGVRCTDRCNRTSYIPLRLMAAKRGARSMLRDVVARLRCQLCKTAPSAIWLVDYPVENSKHGGQTATWHLELELEP